MATTHLWTLNGGTSWSTAGVKCKHLWVWDGSTWRSAVKQWIWDGSAWQLGFDTTPGALASITISPSSATVSQGTTQTYTAQGFDADGNVVTIPSPSWSISTISDTITPGGSNCDFNAGSVTDTGTITCTSGSISGSATYDVP